MRFKRGSTIIDRIQKIRSPQSGSTLGELTISISIMLRVSMVIEPVRWLCYLKFHASKIQDRILYDRHCLRLGTSVGVVDVAAHQKNQDQSRRSEIQKKKKCWSERKKKGRDRGMIIVSIEKSDGGRRARRYYSSLERCSALIPILSQCFPLLNDIKHRQIYRIESLKYDCNHTNKKEKEK